MKKYMIGFIIGLFMFPLGYEIVWEVGYNHDLYSLPYRLEYGVTKPFYKRCTKDVSKNGHGWVFIRRKYNRCGPISIFVSDLLWGEYTKPRDPELEKQACKDCKL